MEQYTVTGMSCAACQARVEKAVRKVPGVTDCSVSGAGIRGGSDTVKKGSLSARIAEEEEALRDRTTPVLKKRLLASVGFLLVLMYFSMGHMMWNWPLPAFFKDNHVAMGLVQLLLAGMIMVINQKFFISGFKSLFHGAPNMDSTIALGSGAAFVYSTVMLLAMTRAQADGDSAAVMRYMMEFYFESAAMILTLITVGKMLESYSKGKTTNALRSLMKLAPETANVIRDGAEVTVPIDDVREGDIFTVRPGENIPVDGIVLEGSSAVNEAALTGESIPVDKAEGDSVSSATLNQSGFLKCRATRVGEDTSLARIISMVSDAAATKAPVARLADTISGYFVPAVIGIALVTLAAWLLAGQTPGFALARAICVLVVSCPCALGLATPVAIMVGSGLGARNGILFKNAEALQETGNIQIAALDKTGTITNGQPRVTDLLPAAGVRAEELLEKAYALELKSEHPLANAVTEYGREQGLTAEAADDFRALPGNGLTGTYQGKKLTGGSFKYISGLGPVSAAVRQDCRDLSEAGKTPLLFMEEGKLLGIIAVADTIKEDSAAIGRQAGVNEVIADVLPDGKEAIIRRLQEKGRVAMIGDGINDAPALTRADIGIAIGAGTDVAMDAADVVLMKSRLTDASAAVRLSRQTYRNILENLFWALFYNVLLIPVAAGAYVRLLGITMDPMLGAAAMSLSSFCVVSNALRLNLFRVHDDSRDRKLKHTVETDTEGFLLPHLSRAEEDTNQKESEESGMKKTIRIEGMMCPHCEATVKKALEKLPQVDSAEVSHTEGTAVVSLNAEIEDAVLKETVEAKDYDVTGIE